MDKPRRFKLRNGIIVEEWDRGDFTVHKNGYIDDYKIIDKGDSYPDYGKVGDWLCLGFNEDGFPVGFTHGTDFDIIEEVSVV
jgi:hypothetical protein